MDDWFFYNEVSTNYIQTQLITSGYGDISTIQELINQTKLFANGEYSEFFFTCAKVMVNVSESDEVLYLDRYKDYYEKYK
jgi:hypothetical protein